MYEEPEKTPEAPAALTKIDKLTPASRQLNIVGKIVSKGAPREVHSQRDGSTHRVADLLIGDETASIYLTLWDDTIDKVGENDVVEIKNGYVSLFKGSMRLNTGRHGTIERTNATMENVNTELNMSNKSYADERRFSTPTYRPFYREDRSSFRRGGGSGGRRGFRRH